MKVEKSIVILAAPEKIWPYLVEPAKIMMWFDTIKKCEYAGDRQSGEGTAYYMEEKTPGPLRKINFTAAVWEENKSITLSMITGENVSSYEIQLSLEKADAGTTFNFVEEVGMPFGFIGKILGALGQGVADRMVEAMLVKLKNLSEETVHIAQPNAAQAGA